MYHSTTQLRVYQILYRCLKTSQVQMEQQRRWRQEGKIIDHPNRVLFVLSPYTFCDFFVVFGLFPRGMSCTNRTRSIRANDVGSVPCITVSLTDNIPNLFGPKQEAKKHQPKPKPKMNSSCLCPKLQPDYRVASSRFGQHVQKGYKKVNDGQAYAIRDQATEDNVE